MKRTKNKRDDDEELDQMLPEYIGIDIGDGPDVILGRDVPTGEPLPRRRDAEGNVQRLGPYVPYLTLEQLSDLKPAQVAWLWPGRIAMARLTLIAGESQVGKSLVALDIAARVSRGAPWPDMAGLHVTASAVAGPVLPEPDTPGALAAGRDAQRPEVDGHRASLIPQSSPAGNVLVLGMNRAAADDVVQRLTRAGADMSKVFFADGTYLPESSDQGWKRPLSLVNDQESLYKTIRELSLRLVIVDPLWVFTGARGHAQGLRIAGLADLAAESGAAIVGVADLARDNRGRGSLRVKGERALTAAAHTVWGIVPHPEDEDMRVLLPLKYGSVDGTPSLGKFGLEFLIAAGQIAWDSQPSPLTVESVLAAERCGGELESVAEWLRALLSRGSLKAKQVFAQARECGISMGTLKRAKAMLGVRVEEKGDAGGRYWVWSLGGVAGVESDGPPGARIHEITCAPDQKPAELIEVAPPAGFGATPKKQSRQKDLGQKNGKP